MKNTLKWRLGKLPTSVEVQDLVKADLITKEEARDIMFNNETEEEVDKKSLESEIKFLRELVTKLSNKSTIIETIRTIQPTYTGQPWWNPYVTWCSVGTAGTGSYTTTTASSLDYGVGTSNTTSYFLAGDNTRGSAEGSNINPCSTTGSAGCNTGDFDSIKTF